MKKKSLTVLTLDEANKLAEILNSYPNVFSETAVKPRSEEEIKLLEIFGEKDGRDLDFSIEEVADDCPNHRPIRRKFSLVVLAE